MTRFLAKKKPPVPERPFSLIKNHFTVLKQAAGIQSIHLRRGDRWEVCPLDCSGGHRSSGSPP